MFFLQDCKSYCWGLTQKAWTSRVQGSSTHMEIYNRYDHDQYKFIADFQYEEYNYVQKIGADFMEIPRGWEEVNWIIVSTDIFVKGGEWQTFWISLRFDSDPKSKIHLRRWRLRDLHYIIYVHIQNNYRVFIKRHHFGIFFIILYVCVYFQGLTWLPWGLE